MKETSETITIVNGGLNVLMNCCNLVTGWLYRSHLLVGVGRLLEAHDHEREGWGMGEAETKGELIYISP